jgi:hypothetical protein
VGAGGNDDREVAERVRTVGELLDGSGHLVEELDNRSICAWAAFRREDLLLKSPSRSSGHARSGSRPCCRCTSGPKIQAARGTNQNNQENF